MNKKIKKFRDKIKKSKSKIENLKLIVELSVFALLVMAGIAYFSKSAFWVDGYLQVNEWTSAIISLIGAFVGGIFTMLGVVLTLNRNISDKENEEEKYLRTQAFIVKSEIEAYMKSIEKCVIRAIDTKTFELSLDDNNDFEYYCDMSMVFDDIYFMSEGVRESFYKIISKVNYDNKKEIINIFIKLYTNHEKIKKLCSNKNNKAIEILNKLIISNCNSNLVILKSNIFEWVDKIKKDYKEEKLKGLELEKSIKFVINEFGKSRNKEFLVEEYIELLKFLEKVSE